MLTYVRCIVGLPYRGTYVLMYIHLLLYSVNVYLNVPNILSHLLYQISSLVTPHQSTLLLLFRFPSTQNCMNALIKLLLYLLCLSCSFNLKESFIEVNLLRKSLHELYKHGILVEAS